VQRDRLKLGPEISDYEVIARAHASYITAEKQHAAALARADEVQKTKALALSVHEQLCEAQAKGRPVTRIDNLELTQRDIADVLQRCKQVCGRSSAAIDYINARKEDGKDAYDDPFTNAINLHPEAPKPATANDLIDVAQSGISEQARFNAAANAIEKDLVIMKEFKNKIGTRPRDFSKEILEIQHELAELKAHRATYPGDPADLVPDSVDDPGYIGIAVRYDDVGEKKREEEDASTSADAAAAAVMGKKPSRAEQRRAARQKAKENGKA
jgi:hypothetical protein